MLLTRYAQIATTQDKKRNYLVLLTLPPGHVTFHQRFPIVGVRPVPAGLRPWKQSHVRCVPECSQIGRVSPPSYYVL